MISYLKSIKKKDLAYRRKFVAVGTVMAAVLIFGTWIPLRVNQWRTTYKTSKFTVNGVVAGDQAEKATPTPTVMVPTADPLSFMVSGSPTPSPTTNSDSLYNGLNGESEAESQNNPNDFPSL